MPSVHLNFTPPLAPDITTLRIWEAPLPSGPFSIIEEVTPVGAYPNYLSEYTTGNANSETDWFSIQWVDEGGAATELSNPVQGGLTLLIGDIVSRVMLRDASINENVVRQESETILYEYFHVSDPYTLQQDDANYSEKRGLTLLTLARCYLFQLSEGTHSFVAGLISETVSSARSLKNVQDLLHEAERILGLSYSVILQMAENNIVNLDGLVVDTDQSRLVMVEIR